MADANAKIQRIRTRLDNATKFVGPPDVDALSDALSDVCDATAELLELVVVQSDEIEKVTPQVNVTVSADDLDLDPLGNALERGLDGLGQELKDGLDRGLSEIARQVADIEVTR
jgi:hypothetical protein